MGSSGKIPTFRDSIDELPSLCAQVLVSIWYSLLLWTKDLLDLIARVVEPLAVSATQKFMANFAETLG